MNYLQLVNKLIQESGISSPSTATVTGLIGMNKRLADWINDGWIDLQNYRSDWKWLHETFSLTTTDGSREYSRTDAGITDLSRWVIASPESHKSTFKAYDTLGGRGSEYFLVFLEYDNWDRRYNTGTPLSGKPYYFTIDPSTNNILLDNLATATEYTITGQYYKAPSELVLDADIPAAPPEFHRAIIQKALMYYGSHIVSSSIYTTAFNRYDEILSKLLRNQVRGKRIKQRPIV